MLNLIPEGQKGSIKKKATQKFMLHEEILHCRGQEKVSRFTRKSVNVL